MGWIQLTKLTRQAKRQGYKVGHYVDVPVETAAAYVDAGLARHIKTRTYEEMMSDLRAGRPMRFEEAST